MVLAGVIYTLYFCLPKCWKKCKEAEFDCCSKLYCKPDCSEIDCSCCRSLVRGVLDGCGRLKVK